MERNDDDMKKKDQRTPIIDGDARPDLNIHGEERKQTNEHPIPIPDKKKEVRTRKEVTTKNRNDKNSLEDYKDGKLE